MIFSRTKAFQGDTERAFDAASTIFSAHGFNVAQRDNTAIEFEATNELSDKNNVLGSSKVKLSTNGYALAVEVNVEGVDKLTRKLTVMPLQFGVFILILMWIFFRHTGIKIIAIISLAPVLAWGGYSFLILSGLKARTNTALDTLLTTIITRAEGG